MEQGEKASQERIKKEKEEKMKIEVEIKSIDNGWIVEDNHYGEEKFFEEYKDAAAFAKKIITRFGRDEARWA